MTLRDRILLIGVCEAFAVALWLVPASVHIVQWPVSGPVRLALLLPAWQLAALLAAGAALSAGAMWRGVAGRTVAPLLILWLWTVPYLPWLPDRLPLLLVFAGPLRWILLAIAVTAIAARTSVAARATAAVLSLSRPVIFSISFAAYAACGLWAVGTNGLIGDEPHYLIISESLLRDGDLQIENNHRQRDYRSYFFGDLRPDFLTRGADNQIYSIHAPGLPALVLPVYAVAGHRGVVAFIAFLAALAALAVFDLAERVAGRAVAIMTWLAVCVGVPFVPYAWSIFPEMPGALIVAWLTLWLWDTREPSGREWLARGLALALLPWLHTKFIVFVAIFGAAFALRLLRRPVALAAWMLPTAVSCLAWLYSFYAIYGTFNPEAPYGTYTRDYVLTSNIPHGLLGIFFDPKFGLFVYSPIYLAAIAGAWWLWRERESRWRVVVLALTVGAFIGSTARLYMFWGGSSAPARFLVPLLPCLAPLLAVAMARASSSWVRATLGLWWSIGVALAIFAMVTPDRLVLFSDPHGRARILEMLQAGSPLAAVVPTFTDPDWAAHIAALGAWLGVSLCVLALTFVAVRRREVAAWRVSMAACVLFVCGGAIVTARPSAAVREETSRRGAVEVLTRFDGNRFRTLDYQTLQRTSPDQLRTLTTMAMTPLAAIPGRGDVIAPLTLPPGRYEARVWFNSAGARSGEVTAEAIGQATFGRVAGELSNPATLAFDLPVTVRRLIIQVGDAAVAQAVTRIDLVPSAVVPPPAREPSPARAIESIPSWEHGFVAYIDEHVYPERGTFWTRGTAITRVMLAPGGASKLILNLSTGPKSGVVTVQFGEGELQRVTMSAETPATLSFEIPAGARLVPLRIGSSTMFRPGEVDPASDDMRGLGCQVGLILE